MLWVLLALCGSVFAAMGAEANRVFKLDGFLLNFWRVVLTVACLSPAATLIEWPAVPAFYLAALFSGAVLSVSFSVRANLTRKKMGRISVLFMPVEVFVAFFVWLAVDQAYRQELLNQPFSVLVILSCFVLVTISTIGMRRHDASWKAFLIVAPLGILHAIAAVGAKWAMAQAGFSGWEGAVAYVYVAMLCGMCFAWMFCVAQQRKGKQMVWLPDGMMRGAVLYAVLGIAGNLFFFLGVQWAPSPAYMTAIFMIAPVWIMLWHKIIGYEEEGSRMAGLAMVLAAIMLVVVTT